MSTSVKHIHNGMRGAPTINGTASTLIAALDALFVTGWGATTALSVTVAGGIATAQLTPGETFDRTAVVLVAGATPAELNGESRVLTTSNTSITWATTAADGLATGTITIKYAPQTSWQKVFAGTNKAAYRSNHVQSNGHFLRIDDAGTTTCRVRGFESMTDVDTGIGPFPTDAQISGGGHWFKSTTAGATPVKYRIFCDERFVIIAIAAGSTSATFVGAPARGFGDPLPLAPGGDTWSTVVSVMAAANNSYSTQGVLEAGAASSTASGAIFSPRAVSALGSSVLVDAVSYTGAGSSGQISTLGAMPSAVDGQVKTSRIYIKEQPAGSPPRTEMPGVLHIPQSGVAAVLADGDFLQGVGDLAGRRLMVVMTASYSGIPTGAYLVDITGPWR